MNPAAITLKNNRTALVIYAILMLSGIKTFTTIGRLEYPEFTIRTAQIITSYPGRTSVQVEEEISEPLEQAIRQMAEVDEITSTSKPGVSIISVNLDESYFELEDIWTDLRAKVNETTLPDGAKEPSILDDIGDVYPYIYALRGDGYTEAELVDYAEDIRDELLALEGVSKVEFHGDQEERIYLEFSSSELAARGYTPNEVSLKLSAQNAIASSGSAAVGTQRLNLVTLGEFETLDELADYRLSSPGKASSVRVSDVFEIRRGYRDPTTSRAHFNGDRVVCIAVSMISGGVVTEIGERINAKLADVEAGMPVGLDIETMFYQPKYVSKSINDFVVNLGQAFFFVLVVMLLFAGWRLAVIVGVLVPSAVFICFFFMPSMGVLLEMMSIAALIISLGLLVDNAVVVSEQILVRLDAGEERSDAVTGAVKSLQIPLLAASGTTIAAFSTIALAPGATSEFTYSLFAVVSLTLLASWVLSITIIPMLCYYFLKPLEKDTLVGRGLQLLYSPYEALLRFTLKLRWTYPALILLLTVGALFLFKFVPNIFFPPNERGQFVVDVELPIGTDIAETEKRVTRLEEHLLTAHADEVVSISGWIGNGGPRWYLSLSPEKANPNYSLLSILTKTEDPDVIAGLIDAIHSYAEAEMPGTRVTAKALESGPPVGDPIQIKLFGSDMDTLYELRDRMVAEIKQVAGTADVRDDWGAWVKQVTIDPDPVRSARIGLDTKKISDALVTQYSGTTATLMREGDKSIPIVLRTRKDFRTAPDRLEDLPIYGSESGAIPLGQVAEIGVDFLPGSILRQDTVRVMTIKCQVRGRFASDALAEIKPRLEKVTTAGDWPDGYTIEYAGEQAESAEAQSNIGAAMPISMSVLALILISQFNSLRRFAVIALTIPPMLIGVVPGLLLTGSSFGFMTLLGLIALMGIIVNNAILLIDEFNVKLADGLGLTDAIVQASTSRFRPIIMTTVTTIIGLLPLALGGGGMWSSMAYAMMFGLAFGTLLTLLLCPVLFFLFFRRTYPEEPA
ncbi:MAG: multidrug efflux pump subunit AcrB [Pseudoalteromonas tetraodonis]|jgi:multidrug efflux pump subunit AcrB